MEGLGIVDYIVFASVLCISSGIGLYYKGRQTSAKEYILSNQNAGILPVSFSLMASFMSAVTLLGVSKENYVYGTQFLVINAAYAIGTPICAYIYLPIFFRLGSGGSVYEYLEKRFGRLTRIVASLSFSLQIILYMSVVLYAPSLTLSTLTQLDLKWNILIMGFCCTFYTVIGGIRAILITDVFQSLLMFSAIASVIIVGTLNMNFEEIRLRISDRIHFFEMSFDPTIRHTFWSQLIGGLFTFCTIYAVNQTQIQRLLSIRNLKRSQISLWLQFPILLSLSVSTGLSGLIMYAYYKGCDPVAQGRIAHSDLLLPLFVMDTMKHIPGLTGLFVVGIFSGSLSTISSAINSLASVTLQDYIQPLKTIPESRKILCLKIFAFLYGILCVVLAFTVNIFGAGVLQVSLTIFGVVGGPLLGLFTLGMFWEFPNQRGALSGFILSLMFLLWIGFGQPKPVSPSLEVSVHNCSFTHQSQNSTINRNDDSSEYFYLYRISYAWYSTIGFFLTLFFGMIISKVFPSSVVHDPNLFVHWTRNKMIQKLKKPETTAL